MYILRQFLYCKEVNISKFTNEEIKDYLELKNLENVKLLYSEYSGYGKSY